MKVREAMSSEVLVLAASANLRDAGVELVARGVTGAPVVDEAGGLVGVLSRSDIALEMLVESAARGGRSKDPSKVLVSEVMTRGAVVIHADDDISLAIQRMLAARLHRIVVTEGNKVVGILSALDVLAARFPALAGSPDSRP